MVLARARSIFMLTKQLDVEESINKWLFSFMS